MLRYLNSTSNITHHMHDLWTDLYDFRCVCVVRMDARVGELVVKELINTWCTVYKLSFIAMRMIIRSYHW